MSSIRIVVGSSVVQQADAVVNAANRYLREGSGVCGAIFSKAGSRELTAACSKIATPLNDGDAVITPAFGITNARSIIHAVGPNFGVTPDAFDKLFAAYYNSLMVLRENGYHSISFPLISSGIFGGSLPDPVGESTKQCVLAYKQFVSDYPDYEVEVMLCVFSPRESELVRSAFEAAM